MITIKTQDTTYESVKIDVEYKDKEITMNVPVRGSFDVLITLEKMALMLGHGVKSIQMDENGAEISVRTQPD